MSGIPEPEPRPIHDEIPEVSTTDESAALIAGHQGMSVPGLEDTGHQLLAQEVNQIKPNLPEGSACGIRCGDCDFCGDSMTFKGNVFEIDDTIPDAMRAYIIGNGFGMKVRTWNHEKLGEEAQFDFQKGIKHFKGTLRSNGEIDLTVTDLTAETELVKVRETIAAAEPMQTEPVIVKQPEIETQVLPQVPTQPREHRHSRQYTHIQVSAETIEEMSPVITYTESVEPVSPLAQNVVHTYTETAAVSAPIPENSVSEKRVSEHTGIQIESPSISGSALVVGELPVPEIGNPYVLSERNIPIVAEVSEETGTNAFPLEAQTIRVQDRIFPVGQQTGEVGEFITTVPSESFTQIVPETGESANDWELRPITVKPELQGIAKVQPVDAISSEDKTEPLATVHLVPEVTITTVTNIPDHSEIIRTPGTNDQPSKGTDTIEFSEQATVITEQISTEGKSQVETETYPEAESTDKTVDTSDQSDSQVQLTQVVETHLKAREALWQFVGSIATAIETSATAQIFVEPAAISLDSETHDIVGEDDIVANFSESELNSETVDPFISVAETPLHMEASSESHARVEVVVAPQADAVVEQFLNKGGFSPVVQEQSDKALKVAVFVRYERGKSYHIIVDRRAEETRLVGSETAFILLRKSLQDSLKEKVNVWSSDRAADQMEKEDDAFLIWAGAMSFFSYIGWLMYILFMSEFFSDSDTAACSCGGACQKRSTPHSTVVVNA